MIEVTPILLVREEVELPAIAFASAKVYRANIDVPFSYDVKLAEDKVGQGP